MADTIEIRTYETVEMIHCPACHQPVEVKATSGGGFFAGPCTCGNVVGAVITLFEGKGDA